MQHKVKYKMACLNQNISVATLSVNGINAAVRRQMLQVDLNVLHTGSFLPCSDTSTVLSTVCSGTEISHLGQPWALPSRTSPLQDLH